MVLLLAIITLLYTFVLLFLLYGYYQVREFFGKKSTPKTTFSIIIPYRNEAENLPDLFESLRKLNYPTELFEIFLINDASEDASVALCEAFKDDQPQLNLRLVQNTICTGSPKKDAINSCIEKARHDYILTTDADCTLPANWLLSFNDFILEKDVQVVGGPVRIDLSPTSKRGFLEIFQQLDFFSLQTASVGGFGARLAFMCNGANFCYSKAAFKDVEGFKGNTHVASGDDIFLLGKFSKAGVRMAFLKSTEAVVRTRPQESLQSLLSQRIRWAAKTSSYDNIFGKFVGLIVLAMNLALVVAVFAVLAGSLGTEILFLSFLFKFNVDFVLIFSSAKFFEQEKVVRSYFWASIVYPFFSSYVALSSLFSGFRWKGRQFKK